MVESKKITKVLSKDKKIKEAVKNGQDAVAVFGARLFNTSYDQLMLCDNKEAVTRYSVALAIANAIATKNSGYLVEANVADMLKELFKTEVLVEVPVKAPAKKTAAKKPAATTTAKKSTTAKKK